VISVVRAFKLCPGSLHEKRPQGSPETVDIRPVIPFESSAPSRVQGALCGTEDRGETRLQRVALDIGLRLLANHPCAGFVRSRDFR